MTVNSQTNSLPLHHMWRPQIVPCWLTGERTTLGLAGGVGILLLAAVDASVFARITVAAAGSGGVLIWRARRLRFQAQSSLQSYPIAVAD